MAKAQRKYTKEEKQLAAIVINNHDLFCSKVLKVASKSGAVLPLIHNRAQRELLKLREECLRKYGYVRIAIVKARQHGTSTGIAAVGYNEMIKAHLRKDKFKAFVLAHREDTSISLFDIVKMYHSYSDDFQPRLTSCSKTEMVLADTGCKYQTATASSPEVGRGMTPQFVHISEIAHIKNAEKIAAGLLEGVGDEPGTEVYYETTANGEGGYFHDIYQRAKRGECDFVPFFAPWFWNEKYQREVPKGFKLTPEEQEYKALYDLTDKQMAWKRAKESVQGRTVKEGKLLFKQEYPANDKEAFQYSAVESFIPVESVIRAMNMPSYPSQGAIIAAYDPSECTGNDEDAFVMKQGFNIFGLEYKRFDGIPQQVQYLKDKLDGNIVIDLLVIDAGGGGRQIWQILDTDGYTEQYDIRLVNYGAPADNPSMFKNKKAEMSYRCREALLNDTTPPSYPKSEKLQMEMTVEGSNGFEGLENGILEMEKKKDLIARGHKSPNGYDAIRQLYAFSYVRKGTMRDRHDETKQKVTGKPFRSLKLKQNKKSNSFRSLRR